MIIFRFKPGRLLSIGVAATLFLLSACGATPSLKERYAGPWGEPTADVMKALASNHVRGCGEFYQKESKTNLGEFAVACTNTPTGESAWVLYLVWPRIDKAEGPDLTAIWEIGGPPHPDPNLYGD